MSDAKHTPGPWEAKPNHRSTGWYVCGGKIELASVNQVLAGITAEECEANARILAAAPDLLAACEDVESKIVDYQGGRINWRPDDFLQRVREAIAKAKGENK